MKREKEIQDRRREENIRALKEQMKKTIKSNEPKERDDGLLLP